MRACALCRGIISAQEDFPALQYGGFAATRGWSRLPARSALQSVKRFEVSTGDPRPLAPLCGYPCTPTKTVHPPLASVPFLRVLLSYPGGDEISIEECRDEVDTVYRRLMNPIEESVESKLMWEGIKKYLHKLTPKECEVMISLYVDHLSVRETAAKLKVDDSTVSTHHKNARDKIRNAMEE